MVAMRAARPPCTCGGDPPTLLPTLLSVDGGVLGSNVRGVRVAGESHDKYPASGSRQRAAPPPSRNSPDNN